MHDASHLGIGIASKRLQERAQVEPARRGRGEHDAPPVPQPTPNAYSLPSFPATNTWPPETAGVDQFCAPLTLAIVPVHRRWPVARSSASRPPSSIET